MTIRTIHALALIGALLTWSALTVYLSPPCGPTGTGSPDVCRAWLDAPEGE